MSSDRSYQPLTPRFHPLIHKLQFLYKKIYNRFIHDFMRGDKL